MAPEVSMSSSQKCLFIPHCDHFLTKHYLGPVLSSYRKALGTKARVYISS